MDESPLPRNQGTIETHDVRSPSSSDFGVAGCSPHRDVVSTPPSGEAWSLEARSVDNELSDDQSSYVSCSVLSYTQTTVSLKPDIGQSPESADATASPGVAKSFDNEVTSFTTELQSRNDGSVAGGGGRASRSHCPLLESLLVWGRSSGDEAATAEHTAAGQSEQTMRALVSPDAPESFDLDLMDFTTDFQTRNDGGVVGGRRRSSRSECPLLTTLLVGGHSSGDETVTAEHTASDHAEVAACRTGCCRRQDRADLGRQAPQQNGVDDAAAVQASPNTVGDMRRRLNSYDLMQIRKMAKIFLKAMRLPPCCRQHLTSSSFLHADRIHGVQHLVTHARNSVLSLLHFACQLKEFRRKPPHIQVALVKAASTGCMVLHLAQSYNCERGCWLDPHDTELRPQDLARLVRSPTWPELWHDVAAVGVFLKSLVRPGNESFDNDRDDSMMRFFSLLNAVMIMSPENVPHVRERDRDIAADVSNFQQSCIILLRHHLESSLSVSRAAELLPTLLTYLTAIRSVALNVRIALLSERMVRRDRVLGDALSLELAMR